jgi:hypothetical protein
MAWNGGPVGLAIEACAAARFTGVTAARNALCGANTP